MHQSYLMTFCCMIIMSSSGFYSLSCNSITGPVYDSLYLDYDYSAIGYRFHDPDTIYPLHHDLEEISGLSYYDKNLLGAIEDETGKLYIIDGLNGKILRKVKFASHGDYESLEIINGNAYIMESNGNIHHFKLSESDKKSARIIKTIFTKKNDMEGMGYDGTYLILACKAAGNIKGYNVREKGFYHYDLMNNRIISVMEISKTKLEKFIHNRHYFNKINDFDPSGIAIHPINNDVYILSADKVLVIMSSHGDLVDIVKLDPGKYKQPEGICFMPDGTLYIANEGAGGRGNLIKISYHRPAKMYLNNHQD